MKRVNNLLNQITDYNNLRLAYLKALRGKRSSNSALVFDMNADYHLKKIKYNLENETYLFRKYKQFKIFDPKERIITAACFEDRIVHHAIINILEPIFEKQFIFHTYACRKNKGTHKAIIFLSKKTNSSVYFLKLDIKKYFDSINHKILKTKLNRIIKDLKCLNLLFKIIDSFSVIKNKGLPIGNLTSQFFANLYLSSLDHFILEKLQPSFYVRYMDDMIILSDSITDLKSFFAEIKIYCENELDLNLKKEVFGKIKDGIPFLGWRITKDEILLLSKTKKRMRKKIKQIKHEFEKGFISEEIANKRIDNVIMSKKIPHELSQNPLLSYKSEER